MISREPFAAALYVMHTQMKNIEDPSPGTTAVSNNEKQLDPLFSSPTKL